mmetsp:Transcript_166400/g.534518  ORF Transcript_166400/g.534518 Transcript_166400/m.534518 type:complete len:259 (+) Transcript_166400:485-1261(+)
MRRAPGLQQCLCAVHVRRQGQAHVINHHEGACATVAAGAPASQREWPLRRALGQHALLGKRRSRSAAVVFRREAADVHAARYAPRRHLTGTPKFQHAPVSRPLLRHAILCNRGSRALEDNRAERVHTLRAVPAKLLQRALEQGQRGGGARAAEEQGHVLTTVPVPEPNSACSADQRCGHSLREIVCLRGGAVDGCTHDLELPGGRRRRLCEGAPSRRFAARGHHDAGGLPQCCGIQRSTRKHPRDLPSLLHAAAAAAE